MEITLNNPGIFPASTVVKAYPRANWTAGQLPPSGAPKGASVAEATVSAAGAIVLTGLTEGASYFAAAEVGGAYRYLSFTIPTAANSRKRIHLEEHTFAVQGEVTTASLEALRHFIALATGETKRLVRVRARLGSGTSATLKLQKNGVDATGFTGLESKSTEDKALTPTAVELADNDAISAVITAVSGTPKNLSITFVIEAIY